jgi:hypothetical protein
MCGIPRSGSTLIWQILQSVFPKSKVLKTHPDLWEADGSTVVSSIRSPHDVAASLLRVRLSRHREQRKIFHDDIITVIRRTKINFDNLKDILIGPHTPILKYEEFYNNHKIIYEMIEEYFNIKIPVKIQNRISGKFSIEKNKKRADVLESFNEVDQYQIHGDHIGQVVPGYWKSYIPKRFKEQLETECNEIGVEWGYE